MVTIPGTEVSPEPEQLECPTCGDEHAADDCTYVVTCRYCDDPAANPTAAFADRRCEDCAATEARNAARERRLAQEGWI